MTIKNIAPRKLALFSPASGYTKIYVAHSAYADLDVVGKFWWVYKGAVEEISTKDPYIDRNYMLFEGLANNTKYDIAGTYYDQMIDDSLLASKFGINISDTLPITTKIPPSFSNISVTSDQIDVGVGMPYVSFEINGDADFVTIEYQEYNTSNPWKAVYTGSASGTITIPFRTGKFNFRVRGTIALPDGVTTDISSYDTKTNVSVDYVYIPPAKPTNVSFGVLRIRDGIERFDLKVGWDWVKGSSASVREFALYYVSEEEYNKTQWSKATIVNAGASTSTVITSFPLDKPFKFKVTASSWGPTGSNTSESGTASFTLTEQTAIEYEVSVDTGIEVNYAHIRAYNIDATGTKQQTFNIDAGTGTVAIGMLDEQGQAPITIDPISNSVNVDGRVITKSMYTASLVLSNLTGEDNPHIRTANKTGFGQAGQGLWTGYNDADGLFKFDIGDGSQYIRWDGGKLLISGDVIIGTPSGEVPIGTGIQGNYVGYIYKESQNTPITPTGTEYPPAGWSKEPISISNFPVWVSTAVIDSKTDTVAADSSWSTPARFNGLDGKTGTDGAGIYAQALSPYVGFDVTKAAEFFDTNLGRAPVEYDTITQYALSDPKQATTRQWINGAWATPALVIHGDAVVDGTLTAEKFVADSAFLNKLGVQVIYDNPAAQTPDPEATYTMKIDLANGSITIR